MANQPTSDKKISDAVNFPLDQLREGKWPGGHPH